MTAVMPEGVALARDLVSPAIEATIGRLTPDVRVVAAFHFGFADAQGHPTGVGGGKALRPALALLSARATGALGISTRPSRCRPRTSTRTPRPPGCARYSSPRWPSCSRRPARLR